MKPPVYIVSSERLERMYALIVDWLIRGQNLVVDNLLRFVDKWQGDRLEGLCLSVFGIPGVCLIY
jgi:hypothetical protein